MATKGLIIINTGKGKGKTTAALGLMFRALGHGFKVCVIQFIKGSWKYGELETAKCFEDNLEFHVMGKGFTWKSENIEEDKKAAQEAWEFSKQKIQSNEYRLIILDEITYAMNYGFLDEQEVIKTLKSRPDELHVVLTGRDASKDLIEAGDMVTEMAEIKHPYKQGVEAQPGVEF